MNNTEVPQRLLDTMADGIGSLAACAQMLAHPNATPAEQFAMMVEGQQRLGDSVDRCRGNRSGDEPMTYSDARQLLLSGIREVLTMLGEEE